MKHEAWTIVAESCKGGTKWEGSWVYASRAVAAAAMAYYPDGPWKIEPRVIYLPKPLPQCAHRSFEIPGRWLLDCEGEIAPPAEKSKKLKKFKKPKRSREKALAPPISLFD